MNSLPIPSSIPDAGHLLPPGGRFGAALFARGAEKRRSLGGAGHFADHFRHLPAGTVYFNAANPDLQEVVNLPWITLAGWEIRYFLAVDGLSILLLLLTTLLTPISILSTWTAVEERVKDFMIFFLLLEVGMVGVFLAQDLFLFYVFWSFTLVPMYFLIGIWAVRAACTRRSNSSSTQWPAPSSCCWLSCGWVFIRVVFRCPI